MWYSSPMIFTTYIWLCLSLAKFDILHQTQNDHFQIDQLFKINRKMTKKSILAAGLKLLARQNIENFDWRYYACYPSPSQFCHSR